MYFGICQHCKMRQATHSHTQVVGGVAMQSRLCDACYQEIYGALDKNVPLWADLLQPTAPIPEKRCSVCNMRLSDYEKTGLLGCPACYDVFKEELLPQIMRMQGSAQHVGKVNAGDPVKLDLVRKINLLQARMATAIQQGKYQEAGQINAEIDRLTRQLKGGKHD